MGFAQAASSTEQTTRIGDHILDFTLVVVFICFYRSSVAMNQKLEVMVDSGSAGAAVP